MPFVPGRVANFSNDRHQRTLFVEAIEHIDRAKVKTEMTELREYAHRPAEHQARLLFDQLVDRIDHRPRRITKVIRSPKRSRSKSFVTQAPT